ncbi:hypothetical protein CEXT_135041 [Caerostris extrusa]|uniref:Uncharacterized protein n=1 Tax=Caerostris extrusa TaxID=172846 RepID=A0AAV4U842_CAEEX|nr:hypothetical protein CEXT_135041 [Caerostris extrusa]
MFFSPPPSHGCFCDLSFAFSFRPPLSVTSLPRNHRRRRNFRSKTTTDRRSEFESLCKLISLEVLTLKRQFSLSSFNGGFHFFEKIFQEKLNQLKKLTKYVCSYAFQN